MASSGYLLKDSSDYARATRIEVTDATTYISKDGGNNMSFTDAVTGTVTLAGLIQATPWTRVGTLISPTVAGDELGGLTEIQNDATVVTGTAMKVSWSAATTSTDNLVAWEIDGSTNLTMGVNKGITALKLAAIAPNGAGASWLIDGTVFKVSHLGAITSVGLNAGAGAISNTGGASGSSWSITDAGVITGTAISDSGDLTFSAASGTTTIQTGSAAGVAREIDLNIPVGAGGAADAALRYVFQLDSVAEAGLYAATDGAGSYAKAVWKIPNYTGDYGAAWAGFTPPSPVGIPEGSEFVAYNSNAANVSSRHYVYSNSAWKFEDVSTGRKLGYQGADVASAGDMALSVGGNYFDITGAVTINAIATVGWSVGSMVVLQFDGAPLVKHATAGGAGYASFQLAGAGDFQASAGDTLMLVYDGTYWREIARTVI